MKSLHRLQERIVVSEPTFGRDYSLTPKASNTFGMLRKASYALAVTTALATGFVKLGPGTFEPKNVMQIQEAHRAMIALQYRANELHREVLDPNVIDNEPTEAFIQQVNDLRSTRNALKKAQQHYQTLSADFSQADREQIEGDDQADAQAAEDSGTSTTLAGLKP